MIEVVGILVPTGYGQHAGTQVVHDAVRHRSGLPSSLISGASLSAIPILFSMALSSNAPPSEVMRQPSNAAVTFLRRTDGSEDGSGIGSVMVGVPVSNSAEVGLDTKIFTSNQMVMPRPPANP